MTTTRPWTLGEKGAAVADAGAKKRRRPRFNFMQRPHGSETVDAYLKRCFNERIHKGEAIDNDFIARVAGRVNQSLIASSPSQAEKPELLDEERMNDWRKLNGYKKIKKARVLVDTDKENAEPVAAAPAAGNGEASSSNDSALAPAHTNGTPIIHTA